MKSVLITGGTGFLGHGLVEELLTMNTERICIYSRGEYDQMLMRQRFNEDPRLRWFIGDVRDVGRLERAMEGVDTVLHTAALKRIEVGFYNPDEVCKTNIIGSMNVIEAARLADVQVVVLVSSDKAFEPVSPYGYSKALAENLFFAANRWERGPMFSVCRYGNVAGSTGSVIPLWRSLIAAGKPITVTDPDCTRFWMTRAQAVDLVLDTASLHPTEVMAPTLPAFRVGDLVEALGASDQMTVTGLHAFEKMHESMAEGNRSQDARRMTVAEIKAGIESL